MPKTKDPTENRLMKLFLAFACFCYLLLALELKKETVNATNFKNWATRSWLHEPRMAYGLRDKLFVISRVPDVEIHAAACSVKAMAVVIL